MSPPPAAVEKKRVDWGTVRSKSGRIDANLSSFTGVRSRMSSMSPDRADSENNISLGDHSITDMDEIEAMPEGEKKGPKYLLSKGTDLAETGHDTDKTQAMQISSRTLDEFVTEDDGDGGDAAASGAEEDVFSENDDGAGCAGASTSTGTPPRRRLIRRPSMSSMEDLYEDFYENIKPARIRCLRVRSVCGKVVNNPHFQVFIILLIVINSIMMGIGTFDFVTENPDVSSVFEKIDLAFLIIFTAEITLQLTFRGFKLFMDGWLVFDFVIVLISWSLSSLQIIRAFRIFRALRLITRVDTLRKLVTALMNVLPNMAAIGCLLGLIFYIFAVMFTVLFKDLYEQGLTEDDYFSSLGTTVFTLTQMMTMDWSGVARECMAVYPWAWAPFILFVAISGFIVFNLIIAVVCDAVATVEEEEKAKEDDESAAGPGGSASSDCSAWEAGSMGKFEGERVRELRSRIDVLMQNQVELQGLIQRIVEDMQGGSDSSSETSSGGSSETDDNCISSARLSGRESIVWSEKSC